MKNMATTTADLHDLCKAANSEAAKPIAEKTVGGASIGVKDYYIHPGIEASISDPPATAIIVHPFVIELTPTEEGFVATSDIATVYELEATPSLALKSYLKSLVDELIWLQSNKKSLSPSILEELYLLQYYLKIVR
jgi:hypothetical protein